MIIKREINLIPKSKHSQSKIIGAVLLVLLSISLIILTSNILFNIIDDYTKNNNLKARILNTKIKIENVEENSNYAYITIKRGAEKFVLVNQTIKENYGDIVFILDSTGRMGEEIRTAGDIIENFTKKLSVNKIDHRLALIEFKDYPSFPCGEISSCDSLNNCCRNSNCKYNNIACTSCEGEMKSGDFESKIHNFNDGQFTTSIEEFNTRLSNIKPSGGGDLLKPHLTAIKNATEDLNYRTKPDNELKKIIILLTDNLPHAEDCFNQYHYNLGIYLYNLSSNTKKQITKDFGKRNYPFIYKNKITWTDYRFSENVYLFNLTSNTETQITDHYMVQTSPSIHNNLIVWQDTRDNGLGKDNIYLYNVTSNTETQITTNPSEQTNPSIHNNLIVWQDTRNGNNDIYLYNLTSNKETKITTNPSQQTNSKIYKNLIIWQDTRNGNNDIYLYNLTSGIEIQITNNQNEQTNPSIHNNLIVWQDTRNGNNDIYLYNLTSNTETKITANPSQQTSPSIHNNLIVWQDTRDNGLGKDNIYLYNLTSNIEIQITNNQNEQTNPSIYNDLIVWVDKYPLKNTSNTCYKGPKKISDIKQKLIDKNIIFYYINKNVFCQNNTMKQAAISTGGGFFEYKEAKGVENIIDELSDIIIKKYKPEENWNHLKVIFYNDTLSWKHEIYDIPLPLETKKIRVPRQGYNLKDHITNVKRIEIYLAVITDNGEEITGPLLDTYDWDLS